jgi:hypothetical protein
MVGRHFSLSLIRISCFAVDGCCRLGAIEVLHITRCFLALEEALRMLKGVEQETS